MKKSFPFEFEAYLAGTAFFNRREKGSYVDLLCMQAGKGHLSIEMIKDILNGDFECWEKIKTKFGVDENGLYFNKKLETVKKGKHKKTEDEIAIDRTKLDSQLKEKKQIFYDDCKPFLVKYPKEMLRRFYNYWTEMNKSGTWLRFELQQTFEIGKRLATWAVKDKEMVKTIPLQDSITYKELLYKFNKGETNIWEKYEPVTPGDKRSLWKIKSK